MITDNFLSKNAELRRILAAHSGCRLGEAAACSRKVHTVDPYRPEVVTVVKNADAGKVFYGRNRTDEIVHIDIFHEVKRLDPVPIAAAVRQGVERYTQAICSLVGYENATARYQMAHYMDIQTGAGGGRVTGTLRYGQKESLKKAHMNHVHISAKVGNADMAVVMYIADAVEHAIISQGIGLRQIENLLHDETRLGNKGDMSAYTAFTDSFLRENHGGEPGEEEAYGYELTAVADILENLESISELSNLLSEVAKHGRAPYRSDMPYYPREARLMDAWTKLEGYGYVDKAGHRYKLSDEGMELNRKLMTNARELEAELRKQSLMMVRQPNSSTGTFGPLAKRPTAKRGLSRRVVGKTQGELLAVTETVTSALVRGLPEQCSFRVEPNDLHYERRLQRKGIDICLLIDASASMMGKRIKAAKGLAEHLVSNSRDRISVITFQEQAVSVVVPFTRNHLQIKASLDTINPGGLTPLAAGLRKAASHINTSGSREGLLLLITDGIPTLGEQCTDPLRDALEAALDFHEQTRFHLSCIGLQPNRSILRKVVEAAEGSLHVIDELNTPSLLRIAETERARTAVKV